MKIRQFAVAALGLCCLGFAALAASTNMGSMKRASSKIIPRSAFLTPANLVDVQIAPTGALIAFLRREGDTQSLWLLDSRSGGRRKLAQHNEATRLHWSTDGRWLFLESNRALSAVSAIDGRDAGIMSLLGEDSGRSVLGVDTSRPGAMLVREQVPRRGERKASSFRVLRLAPSKTMEALLTSAEAVDQFVAGEISFARVIAGDHFSVRRIDSSGHSREVLRCVRLEQCSLLASLRSGELLLTGDVGGDLERLVRLDGAGNLHTIHQDSKHLSDLQSVALDPASGEPVLASYRSGAAADYAVAPNARSDVAAIRNQLDESSAFKLSVARSRWLVAETNDRLQHPRWHLYDPRTKRLSEILADTEASARRVDFSALADRRPISFRASDGMTIHGFLTLPNNVAASKAPLLVHVHGGPWSHVEDGYSTMSQFLASRGYAVFEPNFRGSTGYGRTYMRAGKQEFGNGRVHRDIVEGTQALLSRGIGDPDRVGIMGSSFGGYSALQGVTFAPELFQVAGAGMPPPDFGWVMQWQVQRENTVGHEGIGLRHSLNHLELNIDNLNLMNRLSAQSPLANAHRLRRPVLIIAGGKDRSVPLRSIVDYAARLKASGRRVSVFVDAGSGHRVEEPEVQEQYLYLVSRMLRAHLGGNEDPQPDTRTKLKIKRKLRLDDWGLAAKP